MSDDGSVAAASGEATGSGLLSSDRLQVVALQEEDSRWVAQVSDLSSPDSPATSLREGDRLADGVVGPITQDGVFVRATLGDPGSGHVRWLRFTPPMDLPAIPLGPETTRISEPLLPDGTPNYGAWLNLRYGRGVTAENNAAPLLTAAVSRLVDPGRTFWDDVDFAGEEGYPLPRIVGRPWRDEECPECVERLKRNAEAFAAVATALQRPRWHVPAPEGGRLFDRPIPSLLPHRFAANGLAGRAMLRLGRGDVRGATGDALTLQRLALHLGQGWSTIEFLVAIAVRAIGTTTLVQVAAAAEGDAAAAILEGVGELPAMSAPDGVVQDEARFYLADYLLYARQLLARRGGGALAPIVEPLRTGIGLGPPPAYVYLLSARNIDWAEALRRLQRAFDQPAPEARPPEPKPGADLPPEERERFETLERVAERQPLDPVALVAAVERVAETPGGSRMLEKALFDAAVVETQPLNVSFSWNETEAGFRLAVLSVALRAHRLARGAYPAALADLDWALLPEWMPETSAPPGYVARYETVGDGFLLTARPEVPNETGSRAFCIDDTWRTTQTRNEKGPLVEGGACAEGRQW